MRYQAWGMSKSYRFKWMAAWVMAVKEFKKRMKNE